MTFGPVRMAAGQAMVSTGWTIDTVRLSRGTDHALTGVIEIASADDRAEVEVSATVAVALAWRGCLSVQVPGELLGRDALSAP